MAWRMFWAYTLMIIILIVPSYTSMILLFTVGMLGILDQVLSQMAKFNVRLKPSKIFWNDISIEFLGHGFDINRVKLSDSRLQGIND